MTRSTIILTLTLALVLVLTFWWLDSDSGSRFLTAWVDRAHAEQGDTCPTCGAGR